MQSRHNPSDSRHRGVHGTHEGNTKTRDTEEHRTETVSTASKDVMSDPAHSDDVGADWSDEGGATPTGPATQTEERKSQEAE